MTEKRILDYMTAREMAYEGAVGGKYGKDFEEYADWILVRRPEFVDTRRWGNTYEVIIQDPEGNYWGYTFTVPDEGAGDSYMDEDCELYQVRPREKTVIVYEPIK